MCRKWGCRLKVVANGVFCGCKVATIKNTGCYLWLQGILKHSNRWVFFMVANGVFCGCKWCILWLQFVRVFFVVVNGVFCGCMTEMLRMVFFVVANICAGLWCPGCFHPYLSQFVARFGVPICGPLLGPYLCRFVVSFGVYSVYYYLLWGVQLVIPLFPISVL